MKVKPLEVYAEDSNYGIVRMPGRNYPGCVVQGDSLYVLWQNARAVAEAVKKGLTQVEDFVGAVEVLHNALLTRLLHYQEVLQREGLDLPYVRAVREGLVTLAPADENSPSPRETEG